MDPLLLIYILGGCATAFGASLFYGTQDGDWRNWDEPGRFFAPIGLGIMWPLTAFTFLPFWLGIMNKADGSASPSRLCAG